MKKWIAWLLVLGIGLLPALCVAEDSLLREREKIAAGAGRQTEIEIGFWVDEKPFTDGGTQPEVLAALVEALEATTIRGTLFRAEDGQTEITFALRIRDAEVVSGAARKQAGGYAVSTSLAPGKTLFFSDAWIRDALWSAALGEGGAGLMQAAFAAGEGIFDRWLSGMDGAVSSADEDMPATEMQKAARSRAYVRIPAARANELFAMLLAAPDIREALAAFGVTEMFGLKADSVALVPTDQEITVDLQYNDAGELVYLHGDFPQTVEGVEIAGDVLLNGLANEKFTQDSFQTTFGWQGGGKAMLAGRKTHDARIPAVHRDTSSLMLEFRAGDGEAIHTAMLETTHLPKAEEGKETFLDYVSFRFESVDPNAARPSPPETKGAASDLLEVMRPSGVLGVDVTAAGETVAVGELDFETNAAVEIKVLGVSFGGFGWRYFSASRVPLAMPENSLDIAALSADEMKALGDELEAGLEKAAETFWSLLPPALADAFAQYE